MPLYLKFGVVVRQVRVFVEAVRTTKSSPILSPDFGHSSTDGYFEVFFHKVPAAISPPYNDRMLWLVPLF